MYPKSPFPETRPSLLGRLQQTNPGVTAWREFFEEYAPSVFRVARRRGLGTADADDVTQQVMIAVSAHIAAFDGEKYRTRFRHWIRLITANKIHDFFRRCAARPDSVVDNPDDWAAEDQRLTEAWDEEFYLQDLYRCLNIIRREIAPQRFQAFEMYVLQGVSAAETAEALGMTRTHVYVTRTQIICRLRELFDELNVRRD